MFETRAKGKLLLSGEYAVLDGATALAMPVRFGQSLRAEPWKEPSVLGWTSKNEHGANWFLAEYTLDHFDVLRTTDPKVAQTLANILKACRRQNPAFLQDGSGWKVLAQTDFPRLWGLGTSSTLVAAIARWASVDPYALLADTFGGSGYDIACAYADGPILYTLEPGGHARVEPVQFDPPFKNYLYFVYLEKKQDSREGIRRYREMAQQKPELGAHITALSKQMLAASNLSSFEEALRRHEQLIAAALDMPRAKDLYFADFPGEIKSLGAWGGDFVLATAPGMSRAAVQAWFGQKGFGTVLGWEEMVL